MSATYSPIQRRSLSYRIPQIASVAICLGFITFMIHEISTSPLFRVQRCNIVGNEKVSETAIRHLSNIRYEQHLFSMNIDAIAQHINEHPWVKSTTIERQFPSTVHISIEEYKPVLQLALEKLWYVDADGIIFRQADSTNLNYPFLTGIPQDWVETHPTLVQKIIVDALAIYAACDRPLLGSTENISEINFHKDIGFRVILRNGTTLSLGFYEPDSRLDRLHQMVAQGLDLSIPQRVDLDSENIAITKPLTKLHQ